MRGEERKLVASGEPIDQKDNEKLTALAHALQDGDLIAARRLLDLGARADCEVGYGDVPVALMPVMQGDIEAVRMLKRAGVDFAKVRYRGASALEYAMQTGNEPLLKMLGAKQTDL